MKQLFKKKNIRSAISSISNRKDLPTINIKIPFDNYEIILKERSNAINNRVLSSSTHGLKGIFFLIIKFSMQNLN